MIGQRFYIDKYDWQVMVLYEVGSDSADIVIGMLESICDDNKILDAAYESLSNAKPNTGFTYSDYDKHRSFMVIGKTTSIRETINTIVHEANHLKSHIATEFDIDEKGEEVCYLIGSIVGSMYNVFRKFICA